MSTQTLEAAIKSTRSVLAAVTPDQLGAPTPCASWTVTDLINHVIGAQYFFTAGATGQAPAEAAKDFASGDFVGAFDEASSALLAAFGADGVMQKMLTLPFGQMPGAAVVGLAATDTFTHGWDLAKATGQSTDLAPELAAGLLAGAQQSISAAFRGEDGKAPFTAEQPAPEGASNADKLAAFLGRIV